MSYKHRYMQNAHFLNFLVGAFSATLILFAYHRFKMGSYDKFFKDTFQKSDKQIEEKRHHQELDLQKAKYQHEQECEQKWQEILKKIDERKKQILIVENKAQEAAQKNERLTNELHNKIEALQKQETELQSQRQEVLSQKEKLIKSLEEISNLSKTEAEEKLFERLTSQAKKDCALWEASYFKEKKALAEQEVRQMMILSMDRLASACTSQATLTMVHLPHEDFKSKIIGREGRNINFLENLLGVNLLVDETPKTVLISATDPFRKAVAKETLEKLILDGRIHPTKIEEEYEAAKLVIEKKTIQKAEDYALALGITDLHPKIIRLLAKMDLMHSLGQNLLDHSYQVALIMNIIASELNLNADLAKRIGLLHDIGKAAPAEVGGTHALIGQKLCLKYGEKGEVANGVGCHHNEITSITIEGSLCGAADTLSAARPGARTENMQHYIKRMKQLEEIAYSFPEIEKAYILQAGREIRVITQPEKIDDASLSLLAQSLAKKIESQLNHPGKIKVSVFRQRQVVEFAFA